MIPQWLTYLSILSLVLGALTSLWIAVDLRNHPAKIGVMNAVWPICALFGSILLLWFYLKYGRNKGGEQEEQAELPYPAIVAKGALHCGAGCSLGDLVAENIVFFAPVVLIPFGYHTIFSEAIFATWVLDYIFAYIFGIIFQYFAIVPMRGLSFGEGVWAAVKADTLSLTSWQVGMYGFMAIAYFGIFGSILGVKIDVTMPTFWFVMQIAMLSGFVTSYPVNWWLIHAGWKERM